jgi:hypothetical protein
MYRLFKKNEPVPSGVAMSELSNGIKKHTSKSRETIPLKGNALHIKLKKQVWIYMQI